MEVFLYNSTVCRLCGEENDNGTFLYSSEENSQNLCKTINAYLPIKVSDDGQLPRTICPGCTIQLEATVEFLNLIINGQKVIRKLYQREKEYKRSIAKGAKECDVDADNIIYEINTTDGVYLVDHPASLHIAGLEKPKRKRGRPPKSAKSQEETTIQKPVESVKEVNKQQNEEEPSGKRRRKTPTRYKEAVQGPELERILIEEGVIDEDEKTVSKAEAARVPKTPAPPKEPQVIGHLEISGEPIVVMRSRGRPKGPSRQKIEVCPICDMKFTSVGRYMSHVARHGPVQFKCGCDIVFATRQSFCEHQKETGHTGRTVEPCPPEEENEETNAKTEIKDEAVSQDSTSQTSTDQTMTIVDSAEIMQEPHETPTVAKNELEGEIMIEIQEEEINVEGDYVITTSEENNEVNMDSTIETTTEAATEENGQHKFKCQFCPKVYNSKQSKSLHMKAIHMGERGHVCGECGARFAYPRSLALHKISHRRARNRGFACDLCGKVLNHPSSVVYHKQSEHAAQRFVCGTCGKSFRHKQLLQRHQLVHSEARPYACKICNSRFKTRPNLMNHQLLHSGIKKFSCPMCKVKFAHKTSLTLHMRWHTGHKPFVCGVCGKSFSQKGNLSEHERIHTGEKPFACSQCPRRFTTSSQHRLHVRRHELAHQPIRIQVENPEQEVVIESPQKQLNASNKVKKPISLLVNESQMREEEGEQVIYVAYESADGLPSFRVINEESIEIEEPQASDLYSGSSLLVPSQLQALQTNSETIYLDNQQLLNAGDLQMQQMEVESGEIENEQLELENVQLELETEDILLEDNNDIIEEKVSADHIQDARGQGLQFTMQDGTRLALASIDGGAIQVITHDGQTIPVEINGYNEDEESHSENILQHLNVVKSEDSDNVTYFISNVSSTWQK